MEVQRRTRSFAPTRFSLTMTLQCNPKKTEIIHFSSHFSLAKPVPSIKVGDCPISLSNEVKDLGVTLDRHLTLKTHINICRSASRSIDHIGKIRNLLSRSTTEVVLFTHLLLQNWTTATVFFMAYPPMS